MPVNPSSAYTTFALVTNLARALLNDQPGATYSDKVLIPYMAKAYRKVQRALRNSGQTTFINDNVELVVPALAAIDPSAQVSITDATAPPNQLPVDLIFPSKLWERPNGTALSFSEMLDMTEHGGLPSEPQGQELIYWEWRSDGLYFLGALQDTQIRIRYVKMLIDPTDATSQVAIRDAIDAVASITAGLASMARGSPIAQQLDGIATDDLFDLKNESVRRSQKTPRRRRPYGSRNGSASWQGT